MSEILTMVDELEPTSGFEFRIQEKYFKFRNLSGFSERKNFLDNAKAFAKKARDAKFQEELLNLLPENVGDTKKQEIAQFLKTRTIEDWELCYQIEYLSSEPRLSTLEAIMVTRVTMFVDNFTFSLRLNESKGIAGQFAKLVEDQKKESTTTESGGSASTSL